jgi:hypothetical protein
MCSSFKGFFIMYGPATPRVWKKPVAQKRYTPQGRSQGGILTVRDGRARLRTSGRKVSFICFQSYPICERNDSELKGKRRQKRPAGLKRKGWSGGCCGAIVVGVRLLPGNRIVGQMEIYLIIDALSWKARLLNSAGSR